MKFTRSGYTLSVSGIKELATVAANSFQAELNPELLPDVKQIDLDLSETDFVDCGGLGALVGLQKRACSHGDNVTIRLLNPPLPLRRIVSLMRLDSQFRMERNRLVPTGDGQNDSLSIVE